MIIFFDGFCVLCNSAVDFLIHIDKKHLLKFAPLQGRTYSELQKQGTSLPSDTSTLVVWFNGGAFTKSSGFFKALDYIGGPWKILTIFKFIPAFISDAIYDFIAKNRYKWFGKKDICRIPTAQERAQFLD